MAPDFAAVAGVVPFLFYFTPCLFVVISNLDASKGSKRAQLGQQKSSCMRYTQ